MDSRLRSRNRCWRSPAVIRCLWALMIALHVPALIATWVAFVRGGEDPGHLGSLVALGAAILFFVLKVIDVEFLRFRVNRRTLLVMVPAVALMHWEAVGTRLQLEGTTEGIPIIATAVFATGFHRVQKLISTVLSGPGARRSRAKDANSLSITVWDAAFAPNLGLVTNRPRVPRAPPF